MMDAGTLDFATFMNTMKGNNDMFGGNGNGFIWILFILFFFGGYGGFGGFGNRGNNAVEQQLSNDFIYSNLNSQIRGVNEGVIQGFAGVHSSLAEGFSGLSSAISASSAMTGERLNGLERGLCNMGYELSNKISDCCCNTQKSIQQFGYENQLGILNQTNAINQSINALANKLDSQTATMIHEFCNIKSREDQRQITELTAQLNDAKTANLMANQTANITAQLRAISAAMPPKPVPAYITGNSQHYGYGFGLPYFPMSYPCNCTGTTVNTTPNA